MANYCSSITGSNSVLLIDDEEVTIALTWEQFNSKFPTETCCIEELYRRICSDGEIKCTYCGNTQAESSHSDRVIRCGSCRKEIWLTAGTFFHRIRYVRAWLAAIFFMEQGVIISSSRFHKLVGIAYSSAWTIFMKLATLIESQLAEDASCLPSALFERLFCKRSRETPARKEPIAEQEEIEKLTKEESVESVDNNKPTPLLRVAGRNEYFSETNCQLDTKTVSQNEKELGKVSLGTEFNQVENAVYEILTDEPVQFDELCARTGMRAEKLSAALTMLELAELAERLPGDRYVCSVLRRNKTPDYRNTGKTDSMTKPTMMLVDKIIDFVRVKFQGISRKYLQNYLAIYWCHADRNRWQYGSLTKLSFQSRTISYREIIEYVSPLMVKLCC